MADFNVNLSAPSASGAQVLKPVQSHETNFPNPLIGMGMQLAGIFVKNREENIKKEKEERKQSIINEFTRQQTALSDSVMQGAPISNVGARARSSFSQFAASYPELVDDFSKVNKNLFENTELQRTKSATEMAQDAEKALMLGAVKAGYPIGEFTPPAARAAMLEAFQSESRLESEFDKLAKKRRFINEVDAADRATEDARIKNEGNKLLSTMHDTQYESFQAIGLSLYNKSKATGDPTQALIELNSHYNKINSVITGLSTSSPELAKVAKQNFDDIYNFNKDLIEGKVDQASSENRFKLMRNKAAAMAMDTSPEFKAMVGVTAALGGDTTVLMTDKNKVGLDAYLNLTNKFGGDVQSIIGKSKLEEIVYPATLAQIRGVKAGTTPNGEAAMTELGRLGTNTLQTLGNEGTRVPFNQLNKTIDFISRPEFYDLVSAGKIDKQAADGAAAVFQQTYMNGVEKVLDSKLSETFKFRSGDRVIKFGDLVDFKWNGVNVVASSADMSKKKLPLDFSEREEQRAYLREVDKPVQVINQLVRAGAHLEGHNDYAKYWEGNKHMILPQMYPDPAKLKVGQVVTAKNGKKYKYLGGNYNNISASYEEVKDGGG